MGKVINLKKKIILNYFMSKKWFFSSQLILMAQTLKAFVMPVSYETFILTDEI